MHASQYVMAQSANGALEGPEAFVRKPLLQRVVPPAPRDKGHSHTNKRQRFNQGVCVQS
jgi:hypothetical protein